MCRLCQVGQDRLPPPGSRYEHNSTSKRQKFRFGRPGLCCARDPGDISSGLVCERTGTPYPCPQRELDLLQTPTINEGSLFYRPMFWEIGLRPPLTLRQAADSFCFWNAHLRPVQHQAKERLHHAFTRLGGVCDWDLAFKTFNDWDVLFFGGVLRHRVHLKFYAPMGPWQRQKDALGVTLQPWSHGPHQRRTIIAINRELQQRKHDEEAEGEGINMLVGTLFHEMIHAYLGLLTAWHAWEVVPPITTEKGMEPGGIDCHGESFYRCQRAMENANILGNVTLDPYGRMDAFFRAMHRPHHCCGAPQANPVPSF